MSRTSRRTLLAAAPAVLLAACGDEPAPDPGAAPDGLRSQDQGDVELLGFLMEVEAASVRALAPFAARAEHPRRRLVESVERHDREHLDRLAEEIGRLGGEPPAVDTQGDSFDADLEALLRRCEDVKLTALAAYVDAVPKLYHARLQQLAAEIYAAEAAHLTAITGRAGEAFVLGEKRA